MFDIDKARKNGMDEKTISIMRRINENEQRCESCSLHDFNAPKLLDLGYKSVCKNCGYVADITYVKGYTDGLRHAENKNRKAEEN